MSKIRVFFLTLILLGLSYFLIHSLTSNRPAEMDDLTGNAPIGTANMGTGGGEMDLDNGVYYGETH